MKLLKSSFVLVSICAVLFASCSGKDNPTLTPVPVSSPAPTIGPQARFQKYGWSVMIPGGEKIVEKGLIQKEADETSGKVEWGDTSKDGLVVVFWLKGSTRDNYDINTATDSLASSYIDPPLAVVTNFSALEHKMLATLHVDVRSYDFNFFGAELKGLIAVYQCSNPDNLIFINAIHKEPSALMEKVLASFSCS
ncbi:MAG: hypothetical protein EXR59_04340 [Dehalococcoidia bacterium]|nr:hypothetical protein [Dehalococcoidia bacterium]